MKAKYVQRGENIEYKNTTLANIEAGEVVALASCISVALVNIPVGATGNVSTVGVYEMEAETTAAFEPGQALYYADNKLTATSGAVRAGVAVAPKLLASNKALIKIG